MINFAKNAVKTTPQQAVGRDLPLTRRDLLAHEQILRNDLASILDFQAHALYFPQEDELRQARWLAEENKLLLPLRRPQSGSEDEKDLLLGILMLNGLKPAQVEKLLDFLPGLAGLCLDKLALHLRSRTDRQTGLAVTEVLLESLGREIALIRHSFSDDFEDGQLARGLVNAGESAQSYQSTLGLCVLDLSGLRKAVKGHGYGLTELMLAAYAQTLLDNLPEQALAARTGDFEFSVLVPGADRHTQAEMCQNWVALLEKTRCKSKLTGQSLNVPIRAGFALFPQDWRAEGDNIGGQEPDLEARSLFDKARLAASRAAGQSGENVLGFGAILPQGGIVESILPLSRVQTNLGRDVGAREGQRFAVWSLNYPVQSLAGTNLAREPMFKGEVVLADVREDSSQAEILLLGDPAWPLEPGDRLSLVADDFEAGYTDQNQPSRPEPLTGLYRHADFLARLALAREKQDKFCLALIKIQPNPDAEGHLPKDSEHLLAEAVAVIQRVTGRQINQDVENGLLGGRFSLNSLFVFQPGLAAEESQSLYNQVSEALAGDLNAEISIGLACLPWLTYKAADAVECARQALDYAILLPEPHVGIFDSLAITINADKRYSQGDMFGAIEDYRLALLADDGNSLAWNSLGVCLAGVGRHGEARRAFEQAIALDDGNSAFHYNLGTACIKTGDLEQARASFARCLELEPNYGFALIRLGELEEKANDLERARQYYLQAALSDQQNPAPHRCLARLDLLAGKPEQAREKLHQALLHNPQDAFSLHLLARLYLDGGEDPELAETLARQSIALRSDRKGPWLELARALEGQGKHREAREARVKAQEL